MTQQLIPQSPDLTRRQSLIKNGHPPSATVTAKAAVSSTMRPAVTSGRRISEAAGRAAADCTAVCCCCPCTVMNIVVLAVYKVPAGICRKVKTKHRQKRLVTTKKRHGLLTQRPNNSGGAEKIDAEVDESSVADLLRKENIDVNTSHAKEEENDVAKLEKEMWDQFNGTGFWRSPSQRES